MKYTANMILNKKSRHCLFPFFYYFLLFLPKISIGQSGSQGFHIPFQSGEELKYIVRYGFIRGGEATLQVLSTHQDYQGHPSIHFLATGRTSGTLDIFYKVRNQYESYIDPNTFLPYAYSENIHENSYSRSGKTDFDYSKMQAHNGKGNFSITDLTRDIVSSYYYARSIDISGLKPGDKLTFYYFLEEKVYPMEIVYLGREKVESSLGTFYCLKYSPSLEPGRIFRKDSKMYLWITDDNNHIPIKAKADILVGSVILELKEYKNLIKPLKPIKAED